MIPALAHPTWHFSTANFSFSIFQKTFLEITFFQFYFRKKVNIEFFSQKKANFETVCHSSAMRVFYTNPIFLQGAQYLAHSSAIVIFLFLFEYAISVMCFCFFLRWHFKMHFYHKLAHKFWDSRVFYMILRWLWINMTLPYAILCYTMAYSNPPSLQHLVQ